MKRIYPADHIQNIKEYIPIKPLSILAKELNLPQEEIIKLDGNENQYGVVPEVRKALSTLENIQIYPDPLCTQLTSEIAKKEKLSEHQVIVGAGADELIDLVIRGFTNRNDVVLSLSPTFGMYSYLTHVNGVIYQSIPQDLQTTELYAQYQFDENQFLQTSAQARMVFLARPNNPDGQMISLEFIKRLLDLPILLIVDEAYIEFADQPSLVNLVNIYENLIILRTFSKAYALGGLRVGYGLMNPTIKKTLIKIKQPYNVNIAAQEAALHALSSPLVQVRVAEMKKTREWFIDELGKLQQVFRNFWIHKSQAAYVLLTFQSEENSRQLFDQLLAKGILTRYYSSADMLCNLRISIGRPEQMKRVVCELRNIFTGMRKI